MNLQEKIEVLQSGIGGWETIILTMAKEHYTESKGAITYEIAEILPFDIIEFMKIEDKNDELYGSDEAFELICKQVIRYCKKPFPSFSIAAQSLLDEGY